jgi:hypothetical protein
MERDGKEQPKKTQPKKRIEKKDAQNAPKSPSSGASPHASGCAIKFKK